MSAVRPVKAAGIWKKELWIVGRSTLTCTQHPPRDPSDAGDRCTSVTLTPTVRLPRRYPNHPGPGSGATRRLSCLVWRLAGVCQASGCSQSWIQDDVVSECAIGRVPQSPTHPTVAPSPSRTARACPKSPDMAFSGASQSVMCPTPAGPSPHPGSTSAIVPGVCPECANRTSAGPAPLPQAPSESAESSQTLSARTRRSRPQPTTNHITRGPH